MMRRQAPGRPLRVAIGTSWGPSSSQPTSPVDRSLRERGIRMALPSRNIQTGEFGVDTLALLTLAPRPPPPSPRRPSRSIDPQFRRPKSIRSLGTATAHLRDVLGDQTYESLARKGET